MTVIVGVALLLLWQQAGSPTAGTAPGGPTQAAGSAGAVAHPRTAAAKPVPHPTVPVGQPVDPAAFSPGACEAFAPLGGNRHQTVFLDAGHGGIDPGAVGETSGGRTIHEATETLPVVLDAMQRLRGQGFEVVLSRTGATNVARLGPADVSNGALTVQGAHDDVAARDLCADRAGANLLIGVYFDAGASPSNAGSITAYDAARPFAASNMRLARDVQRDVLASLNRHGWGIPDDGAVPDTTLGGPPMSGTAASYGHLLLLGPPVPGWFSTPSTMPGALIEPLFITDPFEGTIAASAVGQQAIAGGLDRAVLDYVGGRP